jgi:hypothetical protein
MIEDIDLFDTRYQGCSKEVYVIITVYSIKKIEYQLRLIKMLRKMIRLQCNVFSSLIDN